MRPRIIQNSPALFTKRLPINPSGIMRYVMLDQNNPAQDSAVDYLPQMGEIIVEPVVLVNKQFPLRLLRGRKNPLRARMAHRHRLFQNAMTARLERLNGILLMHERWRGNHHELRLGFPEHVSQRCMRATTQLVSSLLPSRELRIDNVNDLEFTAGSHLFDVDVPAGTAETNNCYRDGGIHMIFGKTLVFYQDGGEATNIM
jgi:hypothetical protein